VSKLADEFDMAGKTFVDLGSGVGQVCMLIAALSKASRWANLSNLYDLFICHFLQVLWNRNDG
jgi:hypothetical protein